MTDETNRARAALTGQSVKRIEDPRLITGAGQYLEDLDIADLAYVALLRSPHAHANVRSIDTTAASQLNGVLAVVTAADLGDVGDVPVGGDINIPEHPPLAGDVVRFVGDPLVAVVAESQAIAEDALELISVDYETQPAVVDAREALKESASLVHPQFGTNVVTTAEKDTGGVDEAFAAAEHRMSVRVGHGRVAAIPIENRGGIGSYDEETGKFTLWLSTQAAWLERGDLATAMGVPDEDVRVITPDVGGAFGAKMTAYREDILLLALARIAGRPVQWIATRSEDLQSSMHGREAYTDGEVAFDSDGRIRALKLRTVANLGAYLMKFAAGPPMRMLLFPTGAYTIPEVQSEIVSVFTNTGPVGPYRGAGRPEAAYFIERVVSDVAHALGMDQADIRRRNFIAADAFPYTNASGIIYDSGDYHKALDRLSDLLDLETLKSQIEERRAAGEVVGLGLASCVEVSGGGGDAGVLTLDQDGHIQAVTGTSPHGQGLATSFAQLISDELGVALDDIHITHGDTAVEPRGGGTMGSRSLQLGGSALRQAAEAVRETVLSEAAEMLEVTPDDLVLEGGEVGPRGAPEIRLRLEQVVESYLAKNGHDAAGGAARGIEANVRYQADGDTFPFGSTAALVSIDRDTGKPTIERFVSVDDVGNVVNPRLVEGQLIGGAVQGIAETLWEQVVYDDSGQLVSGSLMDYAVPKASWFPNFQLERTVTPTPRNILGAKGVGEAGTVHAPPAVANAVMDALRPFDVEPLDLPITDRKIWQIINRGGQGIR